MTSNLHPLSITQGQNRSDHDLSRAEDAVSVSNLGTDQPEDSMFMSRQNENNTSAIAVTKQLDKISEIPMHTPGKDYKNNTIESDAFSPRDQSTITKMRTNLNGSPGKLGFTPLRDSYGGILSLHTQSTAISSQQSFVSRGRMASMASIGGFHSSFNNTRLLDRMASMHRGLDTVRLNLVSQPTGLKPRERDGEVLFGERIDRVAEKQVQWFLGLDAETKGVVEWQEARFNTDADFRNQQMLDISLAFEMVDTKRTGILNNISFYVLIRELEQKWSSQGLAIREPTPDRELNKLFQVYDDFNAEHDGVSLEDFIECRMLIQKKFQAMRQIRSQLASSRNETQRLKKTMTNPTD